MHRRSGLTTVHGTFDYMKPLSLLLSMPRMAISPLIVRMVSRETDTAISMEEAAKKINEEGYVMFFVHEKAEAEGSHLFCLGKLDPARLMRRCS